MRVAEETRAAITERVNKEGYTSPAEFIREAIREKLRQGDVDASPRPVTEDPTHDSSQEVQCSNG